MRRARAAGQADASSRVRRSCGTGKHLRQRAGGIAPGGGGLRRVGGYGSQRQRFVLTSRSVSNPAVSKSFQFRPPDRRSAQRLIKAPRCQGGNTEQCEKRVGEIPRGNV